MVGKTIHQYQFLEKLGAGGMGEIYKAQDTRLNRVVAIKVLTSSNSGEPERRRRFLQEAQSASALNHPNIITIHDIITESDAQYMVMEYVQGKTLVDIIPKGGLRVPQVLKYAIQMSDALQVAHAAGIIHRDLKPGNIMATDSGLVKILDFGLAKLADRGPVSNVGDATQTIAEAPLTVEGTIIGTVSYMSPEQAQGKKIDARSDIFSFGLVLYEMATGSRAFTGDNALSTLSAILRDEARPIMEVAPDVPPQLEQVITRCLRKPPDDRWQSMREVQQALASLKYESDSGMLYKSRLGVTASPSPASAPPPLSPPPAMSPPPMNPAPMNPAMAGPPPRPAMSQPALSQVGMAPPGMNQPPVMMRPESMAPPPMQMTPPMPAPSQSASMQHPPAMMPPPGPSQRPPQGLPQGLSQGMPLSRPSQQQTKSSAGLMVGLVGAVVALAAAGGGGYWWYKHRAAPPPVEEPAPVALEPPSAEPPPAEPSPAPVVEAVMNNDSILEMVKGKLPATLIISQIRAADKTDFNLSAAEVIRLSQAGVPESVIEAMRNPKKASAPAPTPVNTSKQTPPPPSPPKSAPQQPQTKSTPPKQEPQPVAVAAAPVETPAPAPPPAPVPAPAPVAVVSAARVVLNDGAPFTITLNNDIPANAEEGTAIRFTASRDFKVGDMIVIAKGAAVTGVVVEGAKKKVVFIGGAKMTMRLLDADSVSGQKLKVRGLPGKRTDGQYVRPVETGKSKPKDVAAQAGTEYIAYIDGDQTATVTK